MESEARAVSEDGSIVVGYGRAGPYTAVLWTSTGQIRTIRDLLEQDYGLALDGWSLVGATGISADGRVIVGGGRNPAGQEEAWIAVIPEPGTAILIGVGVCALGARGRTREARS